MNPVCPYCRTEVGSSEAERMDCPACATPHHPECFAENGGCTVFGCAQAPPAEPKISVSGADLSAPSPAAAGPAMSASATANPAFQRPSMELLGDGFAAAQMPPPPAVPGAAPPPVASGLGAVPPPMASASHAYSAPYTGYMPPPLVPKSRVRFVLLGVFLGFLGAHNFYAGYNKKAAIQLLLTLLTCFYGAVVSWIWAIVEVCVISEAEDGEKFA